MPGPELKLEVEFMRCNSDLREADAPIDELIGRLKMLVNRLNCWRHAPMSERMRTDSGEIDALLSISPHVWPTAEQLSEVLFRWTEAASRVAEARDRIPEEKRVKLLRMLERVAPSKEGIPIR